MGNTLQVRDTPNYTRQQTQCREVGFRRAYDCTAEGVSGESCLQVVCAPDFEARDPGEAPVLGVQGAVRERLVHHRAVQLAGLPLLRAGRQHPPSARPRSNYFNPKSFSTRMKPWASTWALAWCQGGDIGFAGSQARRSFQ